MQKLFCIQGEVIWNAARRSGVMPTIGHTSTRFCRNASSGLRPRTGIHATRRPRRRAASAMISTENPVGPVGLRWLKAALRPHLCARYSMVLGARPQGRELLPRSLQGPPHQSTNVFSIALSRKQNGCKLLRRIDHRVFSGNAAVLIRQISKRIDTSSLRFDADFAKNPGKLGQVDHVFELNTCYKAPL